MPASHVAIAKNIQRLKEQALIDIWNKEATEDRTPGQAWAAFIEEADRLKLADKIPGSVGRAFRAKYAEASSDAKTKTAYPPAVESVPQAPRARKAAPRPAPAATGSKAGGSGRSRSKAAQAGEKKEAAK